MLFFKKKPQKDPESVIFEDWSCNFGFFAKKRFEDEKTEDYSSFVEKGDLRLDLGKKNLFAWTLNPLYQYSDFMLEADIGFGSENGYSAVGLIFRHVNDENFCYFLISNKGYFRFDVIFNGNPMAAIPWTKSSLIKPDLNNVMILARGNGFSFYIEDSWVGEIEDDTLSAGKFGFAAQNFNEKPNASFFLEQVRIESRPVEVEKHFLRWKSHIPVDPENRITLAKTFYANNMLPLAAVQMKKAFRHRDGSVDELLFFAEILINLGVFDEAHKCIDKCLELEPGRIEAVRAKANLLYLQNHFLEARDYLDGIIEQFADSDVLWNLLGNCNYGIGNWEKAEKAYVKALELDPEMPLFHANLARALEMKKENDRALKKYIEASRIFFRQEAYEDLYNIFNKVIKLDPQNREVKAFEAKILFHEKRIDQAEAVIKDLIEQGYKDGAIFYLAGVILSDRGEKEEAVEYLHSACELEPDYYLFWYKLAENLLFSGKEPEEAIKKAYELNPGYHWTLNLYGFYEKSRGNIKAAARYFEEACKAAPEELDILINLSDILFDLGDKERAFKVLDNEELEDRPELINHKGNLYGKKKEYNRALVCYERALKADPDNFVYMENIAAACIELDMVLRAEEILNKLFEINPSISILNLIGNLAQMKGEYKRAEMAYQEALNVTPDNMAIRQNLAAVFIHKADYQGAKEAVARLLEEDPESEENQRLASHIRKKFEETHSCSSCDCVWWVPYSLPPQGGLRLQGEPPGDAPAGKCPECGRVFCIECAQGHLVNDRFVCPDCEVNLKLSENWMKYLLNQVMEKQKTM